MGGFRIFTNFLLCTVILVTITSAKTSSDYKDLLSSLYRKAVQKNKPLVVVLDNKKDDRDGETSSNEKRLDLSSSASREDTVRTTNQKDTDKLIAKLLLKELDTRLQHSKITYKNRDNREKQYQDYDRRDRDDDRKVHDNDQRHRYRSSKRSRHHQNLRNLKSLLTKVQDKIDSYDRADSYRHKYNRADKRDDRDERSRSYYRKEKRSRDRGDYDREGRDKSSSYSKLLQLISKSDASQDRRDPTRQGQQSYLRTSVGKHLSALRNGLECAAKDECKNECEEDQGCANECEEKFDECEEPKADECGQDGNDSCRESEEQGSTKGYPEEPEKYCKRC